MKVLVSAYACEPGKGSEPEIGWQWVRQIARFYETWVMTRKNNRPSIESALSDSAEFKNLHFEYIDLPNWALFWKRGVTGMYVYYLMWQMMASIKGIILNTKVKFSISHHVTFGNVWITPGISMISSHFLWGPTGSHPYVSLKYRDYLGRGATLQGLMRYLLIRFGYYLNPTLRYAYFKADFILIGNRDSVKLIPTHLRKKVRSMTQTGITKEDLCMVHRISYNKSLNCVSIGRLVGLKGFRLAIKAFALHVKSYPVSKLTIIGDGAQHHNLKKLINELNMAQNIDLLGKITRDQVLTRLGSNDAFLFPSFEGGGMVVMEAMAKALPVVCLDFGGPGEFVTEDCGIKVPLTTPERVVQGLADALNRLASDPTLYERLSRGALERVREHYTWDRIGEKIKKIYEEVLHSA